MILKILRTGFVLDEKILMSLLVMLTFCLSSSKEFLCTKSTENIFKILTVAGYSIMMIKKSSLCLTTDLTILMFCKKLKFGDYFIFVTLLWITPFMRNSLMNSLNRKFFRSVFTSIILML